MSDETFLLLIWVNVILIILAPAGLLADWLSNWLDSRDERRDGQYPPLARLRESEGATAPYRPSSLFLFGGGNCFT